MGYFVDSIEFITEECCRCHIPFAMTIAFKRKRLKDHEWCYCPAGHKQYYLGKSKEEKLQDELGKTKERLDAEILCCIEANEQANAIDRSRAAYKGVVTKMKQKEAP